MVKVLDRGLEVNELEPQSRYYLPFKLISLEKARTFLSLQLYINSITVVLLQG